MITKPELPPKEGYVEVEVDGVRRYRSVITGMLLEEEPAPGPTVEQLQAKIAILEAQQTFLEDCILEMADEVYA